MENVAHSFAGLLIARLVLDARPGGFDGARARVARAGALVGVMASSVPDGDVLLIPLTGGRLGYICHHRGHTHTALLAPLLGIALALGVIWIAGRFAKAPLDAREKKEVLAIGVLSTLVHVAMDAWNVYGVHPFWPFYSGWIYGDAVFIFEPLLWVGAMPFLFRTSRWIVARGFYVVVALLAVVPPWFVSDFVPLLPRILIVVALALSAAVASRLGSRWAIRAGALVFVLVPATFFVASAMAKRRVSDALALLPGERLLDVAASSFPANPFCFSAVTVSVSNDELILRRTRVALAPGLVALATCPSVSSPITASVRPSEIAPTDTVRFVDEVRHGLVHVRERAARCDVAAAFRFLRAPYFAREDGPDATFVVGDLRFDRSEAMDFSDVELPRSLGACPENVPGWTPPRADLLSP